MKHLLFFILVILLIGCKRWDPISGKSANSVISKDTSSGFASFDIQLPTNWKKVNDDDSTPVFLEATAYYKIRTAANKMIYIADGTGADDWSDYPYVAPVSDKKEVYEKYRMDTAYVIFSDNPKSIVVPKIHKIRFEKVSGFKAKIFEPKKIGYGFTGVYIDNIGKIDDVAKLGFELHGDKLDSLENKLLLKAIKTIKLKPSS